MVRRIVRGVLLLVSIAVLVLAMGYPYLGGEHDPLAVGLSTVAQAIGIAGIILVPLGAAWLIADAIRAFRRSKGHARPRGRAWPLVSVTAASLVVLLVALLAGASGAVAGGVLFVIAWAVIAGAWMLRTRRTQYQAATSAPLWMVALPIAALAAQLLLASPATDAARAAAVSSAGSLIADIEAYQAANNVYPASLAAVYADYPLGVVGIGMYQYSLAGDSYNLSFELPRFLLDDPGSRELVVFNPRDEHVMISHSSWILLFSPPELLENQGWYANQDAGAEHWRSFLFD